jgi:hypothetical protein
MQSWTFTHLSPGLVLKELDTTRRCNRHGHARELALIAEVDDRRIYAEEGFPGIREFCFERLGLRPDAAAKRIQAARKAREFPVLFEAIADGRLCRSAVALIAPHVTELNLDELIRNATGKSYREIEDMLAGRGRVNAPHMDLAAVAPARDPQGAAETSDADAATCGIESHAAPHVEVEPRASQSLPVQFIVTGEDLRLLLAARELHPTLDTGALYRLSLKEKVLRRRKAKFGIGSKPGLARTTKGARTIAAHVRRDATAGPAPS